MPAANVNKTWKLYTACLPVIIHAVETLKLKNQTSTYCDNSEQQPP